MFKNLFKKTDSKRRRIGVAAVTGLIGGLFSAIVKFGWEVPFPPRTPERNATNPPQMLLEQLGMTPDQVHTTVSFNGNDNLPIYSFIIHFSFAIVFALFYCIVAEYFPGIKLWQGAAFGLLVWIGFHLVLMPLMGTVPSPFPWVEGGQSWLSTSQKHWDTLCGCGRSKLFAATCVTASLMNPMQRFLWPLRLAEIAERIGVWRSNGSPHPFHIL